MTKTMTELEVHRYKMGRHVTEEELMATKGNPRHDLSFIVTSTKIYKTCDICDRPFCVNNYDDKKSRTPKYKDFVICVECDPRHPEDRWVKERPRILWKNRLRIVHFAMISRALAARPCSKPPAKLGCKCPECVAGKLMPPF